MTDKTKSQTYNFLIENKSIEDIKKQTNTEVIEKSRHGGSTFKIIVINNTNNQIINNDLSENEIFYDTYDTVDDLNDILAEQTVKLQTIIQEQTQEIQQLKKENEKLKQSNINFDKFKYNAVTIYDEKQLKNTGIKKIHEEILPIEDKLFFIITLVYNDGLIFEEIIYFDNNDKNEIEVWKQTKRYHNIEEYKKNTCLIDKKNQFLNKITVKDFLKQQQDFKLKPNKSEKRIWWTITIISLSLIILTPILTFAIPALIPATATALLLETKIIIAVTSSGIGTIFKGFTSIFSSATKKVESWWYNKLCKNNEKKDKEKKERQSIIKNLSTDKLETKLQTQYEILKQELDNRKDKNPDQLINKNIINHNLNNISQNLNIESENQNFNSSVRDTINQQEQQPSTSSNHNWNKVKCLLTT